MYAAQGSYVLVKVNRKTDEELASGLVIPSGSDPQAIGEVVSAGQATYEELREGVSVLFQPYRAAYAWTDVEDTFVIIEDAEIFAVLSSGESDA